MNKSEAKERLLKTLKPGQRVYTMLNHVSSSGMSRSISLLIVENNDIRDITFLSARAMGYSIDNKKGGIKIKGCGGDKGFTLVYDLGRTLWPNGGQDAYSSHQTNDGGYLLNHTWL